MGLDVSRPHIVFNEQGEVVEYGLTPIEAAREEGARARSEGWEPSLYHGLSRFLDRADAERNLFRHVENDRDETNSIRREGLQGLPFLPLGSLLEGAPDEPDWLWSGYLSPGACTLLAGRPKVGKSTLVFGLLRSLESGQPFLDRAVCQTRALILSEERRYSLAEKARRFGITNGAVDVLLRHEAHGASWPEVVEQALAHCLAREAKFLVVDTWDKWAQFRGDEENSTGAVLAKFEPLQQVLAAGIAVLLVAHQRKSGGEYGAAVKGSNAITGAVDVVVEVERVRGFAADNRVLRAVSRFESTPEEIAISLAGDHYTVSDAQAVRRDDELERLLEAGKELGEATAEQLTEETGISRATIRKRLEKAGIEHVGTGKRGDPWRFSFDSSRSIPRDETNSNRLFDDGETL
jgi:hypothetical protein